jgi:hypothetical protein
MTPTPKTLYIHDDLTDEISAGHGAESEAARSVRALFELVSRDVTRTRILTLEEQLAALSRRTHPPFSVAISIGRAGERVASQAHARTGWFPRIERVDVAREERDGGYALSTLGRPPLAEQLAAVETGGEIAVVDDTIFSGLTMLAVLRALPTAALARTQVFCLRAVGESLAEVGTVCPTAAGFVAHGRLLEDVSFINASGLVRRGAIRRAGQPPLAFYERPEWMRAWFLEDAGEVTERCAALARLLGEVR